MRFNPSGFDIWARAPGNWPVVIEMRKKDKLILCIPGMIGAVAEGPLAIFGLLVLIALLVNNL
jgi:hypothetical protein